MVFITTCAGTHQVEIKPAVVRNGVAIFGSDADFCDFTMRDGKECGREVIDLTEKETN